MEYPKHDIVYNPCMMCSVMHNTPYSLGTHHCTVVITKCRTPTLPKYWQISCYKTFKTDNVHFLIDLRAKVKCEIKVAFFTSRIHTGDQYTQTAYLGGETQNMTDTQPSR